MSMSTGFAVGTSMGLAGERPDLGKDTSSDVDTDVDADIGI